MDPAIHETRASVENRSLDPFVGLTGTDMFTISFLLIGLFFFFRTSLREVRVTHEEWRRTRMADTPTSVGMMLRTTTSIVWVALPVLAGAYLDTLFGRRLGALSDSIKDRNLVTSRCRDGA